MDRICPYTHMPLHSYDIGLRHHDSNLSHMNTTPFSYLTKVSRQRSAAGRTLFINLSFVSLKLAFLISKYLNERMHYPYHEYFTYIDVFVQTSLLTVCLHYCRTNRAQSDYHFACLQETSTVINVIFL